MAHPDDETFGIGGTLALYARQGVDVHVIVATNGEEGTVSHEDLGEFSSVAELRTEKELRCATETLGVNGLYLLGYRDSGMKGAASNSHPDSLVQAPVDEVAERIAAYMRRIKPQVVITHDPNGNYFHPDHIALHHATVRAYEMAADADRIIADLPPHQTDKLYFNTWPKGLLRLITRIAPLLGINPRQMGKNNDIDLHKIIGEEAYPINAVINYREVVDIKRTASECHHSQLSGGPPTTGILGLLMRISGDKDWYMQAYPEKTPRRKDKDLFRGVG